MDRLPGCVGVGRGRLCVVGGACVWEVWRGLVYGPRLVEGTHIAPVASRCSPPPPCQALRAAAPGIGLCVFCFGCFWFLVSRRSSSSPEPQRR
jgi:hypothetical protein